MTILRLSSEFHIARNDMLVEINAAPNEWETSSSDLAAFWGYHATPEQKKAAWRRFCGVDICTCGGRCRFSIETILTTSELSEICGITARRVRQLAKKMPGTMIVKKSDSGWLFDVSAIDFIRSQPKPGPKKA